MNIEQLLGFKTLSNRTPYEKARRTTLYRYLKLNDVDCHDSDSATSLRAKCQDNGLPPPDEDKVNQAWFEKTKIDMEEQPKQTNGPVIVSTNMVEKRNDQDFLEDKLEQLKRPDLVKLAASLGIKNAIKMKNPDLKQAIKNEQNAT